MGTPVGHYAIAALWLITTFGSSTLALVPYDRVISYTAGNRLLQGEAQEWIAGLESGNTIQRIRAASQLTPERREGSCYLWDLQGEQVTWHLHKPGDKMTEPVICHVTTAMRRGNEHNPLDESVGGAFSSMVVMA